MDSERKYLICLVLLGSALQWSVIGERLVAALWTWYKFSTPYSGGGHITVGGNAQIAFYLLSTGMLAIAVWAKPSQPRWRTMARLSMLSIGCGVLVWTAVLLSPLTTFRH